MGKTYFNLSDSLNFNGKTIKIKANATEPSVQEDGKGRAYFKAGYQSQIYQSVLASQAQVGSVMTDNMISKQTDLRFINSFAQVGRIDIEAKDNGGYFVKTNVSLSKVITGATDKGVANVEDKEWIVVSGLQVKGYRYQFIETALHDIDTIINLGTDPTSITWIVFVHDYVYKPKNKDREHFCKTAENLGIKIELIENRIRFINYINTRSQNGYGKLREKMKITYISIFAHGQTPLYTGGKETQLSLAYNLNKSEENVHELELEGLINFRQSEIEELDKNAFSSTMLTMFYTCNTGTADANGDRFAQKWVDRTGGEANAFQNARSNYIFINSTMDEINLAYNLPGEDFDKAVSDVTNGLLELGHSIIDGAHTELITLIVGENQRETARYMAENFLPVTEEWKIKKQRKEDRLRKDENGYEFGYPDKGSLQYPMLNNIADDWKIILGTWPDKRGFLNYKPKHMGGGRTF